MIVVSDTSAITALLQIRRATLLEELFREAIVLAKERHADILLMDESEGRRVALREGIPFIGLLGVLVQAKQLGLIVSLRKLIGELESVAHFRLAAEIKAIAFEKAGEM